MSKATRGERIRYSAEEDKIIKHLAKQDWALFQVSYQIHKELGLERDVEGLSRRRMRLNGLGELTYNKGGKRFVTKVALDWYNRTFGTDTSPSGTLELVEQKAPRSRQTKEVVGFSKQPSYPIQLVRLHKQPPEVVDLFRSLLQAGINEERTALDIAEDLREVSA